MEDDHKNAVTLFFSAAANEENNEELIRHVVIPVSKGVTQLHQMIQL